jgi:hypothetical protein
MVRFGFAYTRGTGETDCVEYNSAELVELDKPRTGGVHASDIEDEDEDELDRRANRKKVLAKKAAGFRVRQNKFGCMCR